MTTTNLDRVIEGVKALTPAEQRELREWLDGMLATTVPPMTEDEFEQRMLAKGIIANVPEPVADLSMYQNRKLMDVQGKPLSETVIEERR